MTPSPSSEGQDLANLIERLREFECPCNDCTLHADSADAISSLLKEAEGLRAERDQLKAWIHDGESGRNEKAIARAETAEAQLSAATKRADENDERANTYAARADELGQQLFAERQRAEATEGALKDTRALIAAGIENLRATARDVRETERDRLKYAIMASALEGLSEAIEAADRARGLTGEGAER